ncbi:MAG TPA: four helix bundle protein [Candidatus Angelobacter sp.]|jgi:four helix bundle protein|nr:four helix bundle protein [Candidatus Angelobacter sp.]
MTKLEDRNSKLETGSTASETRIRDFTDLQVWQLARELRKQVYKLVRKFPPEEKFGLASQVQRAAISITANIAEGFGRYSYQENIQFCRTARGSALEVRDHLISAEDQNYISAAEHKDVAALAQRVIQTLNGYIRATKERQTLKKPGTL